MRLRLTFAKTGALRYIGHLDLNQVWERTIRRAGLPLAYTQGFHPGPKTQIAAALPLGFAGRAEMIDIWLLEAPADLESVRARLQAGAPPGLTITAVEVADERAPALQTQVAAADYELTLLEPQPGLEVRLQALLEAETLPRQRRGKPYDLRPLVLDLAVTPDGMSMRLAARAGATGRPEEVLAALEVPLEAARITRTRLILADEVK